MSELWAFVRNGYVVQEGTEPVEVVPKAEIEALRGLFLALSEDDEVREFIDSSYSACGDALQIVNDLGVGAENPRDPRELEVVPKAEIEALRKLAKSSDE